MAQPTDPVTSDANSGPQTPLDSDTPLPPPKPQPPASDEPRSGGGWGPIAATAVVVLLAGLLGAAWYFQFWPFAADREKAPAGGPAVAGNEQQPKSSAPSPSADQADENEELRKKIEDLSNRLDALKQDVADLSNPPDLRPIQSRLSALEPLPDAVQKLTDRVAALDGRVNTAEQSIEALRSGKAIEALHGEAATERQEEEQNANAAESDIQTKLDTAITAFREGHYRNARELFDKLRDTHPEDARVWYYSALSTGLTTGEWTTTADRYAREGIDRERAGQPESAKIDQALEDLTTRNGKDWIAAYRRQAKESADSSE